MVRVNLVNPIILTDEHLIAENVELRMLLTFIKKYPVGNVPKKFTLNKGHMSFFRDKGVYVLKRIISIEKEMKNRGFKVNKPIKVFEELKKLPINNCKDYDPTIKDKMLVINRIKERINNPIKKVTSYHYYGKELNKLNIKERELNGQ